MRPEGREWGGGCSHERQNPTTKWELLFFCTPLTPIVKSTVWFFFLKFPEWTIPAYLPGTVSTLCCYFDPVTTSVTPPPGVVTLLCYEQSVS